MEYNMDEIRKLMDDLISRNPKPEIWKFDYLIGRYEFMLKGYEGRIAIMRKEDSPGGRLWYDVDVCIDYPDNVMMTSATIKHGNTLEEIKEYLLSETAANYISGWADILLESVENSDD